MRQIPANAPSGLSTRRVGLVLVGISVGVMLLDRMSAEPARAAQAASAPPFVYRLGPQGVGYYASPTPTTSPVQAAPAARTQPRSVGPGVRNWATGRRSPLHRPWMQARN
jgi:hypothetical protein